MMIIRLGEKAMELNGWLKLLPRVISLNFCGKIPCPNLFIKGWLKHRPNISVLKESMLDNGVKGWLKLLPNTSVLKDPC